MNTGSRLASLIPATAIALAVATGVTSAQQQVPCGAYWGGYGMGDLAQSSWFGTFSTGGTVAATTTIDRVSGVRLTSVAKLVPKKLQRVELWAGTCTTPTTRMAVLGTVKSSASGKLTKSFVLPEPAAKALSSTPGYASVRVGTGKGQRCATLYDTIPSPLYFGRTVRIPDDLYGGPVWLSISLPYELQTCPGDSSPGFGKEYVAVKVEIVALRDASIFGSDFTLRDSNGYQYDRTFGRDPAFKSGTIVGGAKRQGEVSFAVPYAVAEGPITVVFKPSGLDAATFTALGDATAPVATPPVPNPAP